MPKEYKVLDHGYVKLLNLAGPVRREWAEFDASDDDPAICARVSFAKDAVEKSREDNLKLDSYLITHRHNTPVEMIEVWLEMKLPICIARQFVRHRTVSINEESMRYIEACPDWYVPYPGHIGYRPNSMKQGRVITSGEATEANIWYSRALDAQCGLSWNLYQEAIGRGIPPEVARMGLHLNHYTRWVWHQDLHNLFHMLSLRKANDAQWETRQYAGAIYDLISEHLPGLTEIWREKIFLKED